MDAKKKEEKIIMSVYLTIAQMKWVDDESKRLGVPKSVVVQLLIQGRVDEGR